ncbi:lamin tail domain-containing protein [Halobacterium jilantaiense]|uniref:Nuclease homologue n=1 Tax=Halobacterium jilantaiense TaxID=355548 RepID=A0A1I0QGK7_9EURY|nr:DUF4350 domain-containing protein [Halobacterium jilantaiense]SEW25768.1 nuclease homologue [Halobacterium jilantaiense]
MKRRQLLLGIGATVGAGAAISSGAFSNASADRQVAVTVSDDAAGLLSLEPAAGPNGEYVDGGGDRVAVALGDAQAGLTEGATYEFDRTLRVGNQGTQPVYVWAELSSAAFAGDDLYVYRGETGTPLNAANAAEVGIGGSLDLGFFVDTGNVDTDTYNPTITLHASDEPPNGGEDPEAPPDDPVEDPIPAVQLDSVSSLLDANQQPLTDDDTVAIWAEPTAAIQDSDGNGDAVSYPDDADIPVAAVDGDVVGITGPFVPTTTQFGDYGNEEFLLNVYDDLLGGSGTVRHDEGHGQFYTRSPNGGDDFQAFASYAESNGYTYEATESVPSSTDDADAFVVTTPSEAFTDTELDAVSSFVDDGGVVFLHEQSDYNDFDAPGNSNEIAAALSASFRFNDAQIVDNENNTGAPFVPATSNFNTDDFAAYFENREGLGIDLDPSEEYEVDVVSVADGDTVDVQFSNGQTDTVRIVGIDTPETGSTDERIAEYEGITDEAALKAKGDEATTYAENHLGGETVTLSFDENEPTRGNFGRLLGFLELPNGDVYNREAVADGWARVYSSGFDAHDDYWDAEDAAQAAGSGIWEISDPANIPESGDDPVESLFFPSPVAVEGGETVVASEGGDPLVAVDESAGVAAVGGPLVDEGYEPAEAGDGPTNDGQQVYPFVTNVVDYLADGGIEGPVLFDGGHGQFNSDFALSAEDVAYFQRYLEGQSTDAADSIALEGTVNLTDDEGPALLDDDGEPAASALVVTTPVDAFTADERSAVADFAAAGGAVVLVGTAEDTDALSNFDNLTADLGTSVGFTGNAVTDATNNIGGDESLPATTNFPGPADLFTAFTPDGGSTASVEITELDDGSEYVVVENTGAESVDVTDWTLSDEADKTFTFPATTLAAGETVAVTTNETPDDATPSVDYTYNWDQGYVWNGGGDTATLADADGVTVDVYSY